MKTEKSPAEMSVEELKAELARTKDNLADFEDLHMFTFGKTTSLHMSAEKAQNMQLEFEEECRQYNSRIAELEKELRLRGAL